MVSSRIGKHVTTTSPGNICTLDILDSNGLEEYSSLREEYARSAQAFLIVFSISSRSSFEEAMFIYDSRCRFQAADSVPAVLCANQCDREWEREVSDSEALRWAAGRDIPMFSTSAKQGTNINEAFIKLAQITPRTTLLCKIAVFGASSVGKTAMIKRLIHNQFFDEYDPTIVDTYFKQLIVPGLPPLPTNAQRLPPKARRSNSILKAAKRSSDLLSSLFRR